MNLIPKIAEMLGVEIGERFHIKDKTGDDAVNYCFFSGSFMYYEQSIGEWQESMRICDVISGRAEIVKLPFEPKIGDKYFRIYIYADMGLHIGSHVWDDCTNDYMCKYCGNCFRTEAEAEAHKYEIYEKLTGRKWEDE